MIFNRFLALLSLSGTLLLSPVAFASGFIQEAEDVKNIITRIKGDLEITAEPLSYTESIIDFLCFSFWKDIKKDPIVSKLIPTAVAIGTKDGQGSGFFIDNKGYLLTNHHVVSIPGDVTVTLANGKTYKAQFIGADLIADIALLKINANETFQSVMFAKTGKSCRGKKAFTIIGNDTSNPLYEKKYAPSEEQYFVPRKGTIYLAPILLGEDTSSHLDLICRKDIVVSLPLYPGASGSSLYNDAGKVIGIIKAQFIHEKELTHAVPSSSILEGLERIYDKLVQQA